MGGGHGLYSEPRLGHCQSPRNQAERDQIKRCRSFTHTKFVEPIRASVDRVYEERFFDKAYDKLAKIEVTGYGVTRAATVKPGPRLLRCP